MSDTLKKRIELAGVIIGIVSGLMGLLGAWFILPYRVEAVEKRLETQVSTSTRDHEILVRIDERVQQIQETLKHTKKEKE